MNPLQECQAAQKIIDSVYDLPLLQRAEKIEAMREDLSKAYSVIYKHRQAVRKMILGAVKTAPIGHVTTFFKP